MEIVLLLIGALFGGAISWFITHKYSKKSSQEYKGLIQELSKGIKEVNTLEYFQILLDSSDWEKEFISHREVWIAKENNKFQIQTGEKGEDFHEPWIQVYPDQTTRRYPVYLKIDSSIIKELDFISLDGGRIFVPMPDIVIEENKTRYLWNLNSLEVKVGNVIGSYYSYGSLESVARMSKIDLVN